MNGTQYYSATINDKTVVGFLDEDGSLAYQKVSRGGYWYTNLRNKSHFTDLTPVNFVPQDAVVIEGADVDMFIKFIRFSEPSQFIEFYGEGFTRTAWQGAQYTLLSQLTPPKPRPEEPKEFASVVKADKPKSLGRFIWTKDVDGDWQASDGDFYSYSDLTDIEILFDAGQVK